jgi:hypothetical protein
MKLFVAALTAAAVLPAAVVVAPAAHADCYSPAYHWREVCTGAGGAPGPGQTPFTGYPDAPAPINCTYTATGQVADCSSGGPADMPQSPITGPICTIVAGPPFDPATSQPGVNYGRTVCH